MKMWWLIGGCRCGGSMVEMWWLNDENVVPPWRRCGGSLAYLDVLTR